MNSYIRTQMLSRNEATFRTAPPHRLSHKVSASILTRNTADKAHIWYQYPPFVLGNKNHSAKSGFKISSPNY